MITPSIDIPAWLFYNARTSVIRSAIDYIMIFRRFFKVFAFAIVRVHNKSVSSSSKDRIEFVAQEEC
jgi:hypothetical protein